MLRLLVFLQVCHFLTAFSNEASVQACGAKLDGMIAFVCNYRFQTPGKKRSETTFDDNNSFRDVDILSQWLEQEYYRTPDVSSKMRLADIIPQYVSTSRDDTFLEQTYGGLPHQRLRRDTDYVIYGNIAKECCHKSCTISYMLQYCA